MKETIKWVENRIAKGDCGESLALMRAENIAAVRAFHRSFPQYAPTPLAKLDALAV